MFGFGKKKNCKCDEGCCKPKIEVHEIIVENQNSEEVAAELLSHILTPFMDKICKKIHEEGKKGAKAQDKAFDEFDKLLKHEDDFNPWHIAAVLIQNNICNEMDKERNNVKKKSSKTTTTSTKHTKDTSKKKSSASNKKK